LTGVTGEPHSVEVAFVAARKYSVTIAGHETSVRLEPPFWDMLIAGAARRKIPVNALIARIDSARVAQPDSPNLASAIRLWALAEARNQSGQIA
jgi:predicted DNA-binding ribbon-helix-helix protein